MALNSTASSPLSPSRAARALCPHCGFCCNGVLFGDVRLRPGDVPERLAQLGLELHGSAGRQRFLQPCSCFDGRLCRIYAERPERCRTFVCALLQRLHQGRLDLATARRIVTRARQQWARVLEALRAAGDPAPHLPLHRRVARALAEPLNLADPHATATRRRLLLAVERLARTLERHFLSPAPERRASRSSR